MGGQPLRHSRTIVRHRKPQPSPLHLDADADKGLGLAGEAVLHRIFHQGLEQELDDISSLRLPLELQLNVQPLPEADAENGNIMPQIGQLLRKRYQILSAVEGKPQHLAQGFNHPHTVRCPLLHGEAA
ncbi:hypothetical protein D3C81_1567440 [compost metagenome]